MTSVFQGIHDFAYVFTRVGSSVDSGFRQDWLSLGANLAGAAGKVTWWYKAQTGALKTALDKIKDLPADQRYMKTPTLIVDLTMSAVVIIDMMNGFGPPDTGTGFARGVDKFKTADAKLEGAIPHKKVWDGEGADAYKAELAVLRELVTKMLEADAAMSRVLAAHANEVKHTHTINNNIGCGLVAAQGIALAMYMIPVYGQAASFVWQLSVAMATAATVLTYELMLLVHSMDTAYYLQKASGSYTYIGEHAELDGDFGSLELEESESTLVGSFADISKRLSNYSGAPSFGSLSALAGDAAASDYQTAMSAMEFADQPLDDTPDTPRTPTFTPPTMAELNAMSTQVAKFSADVAEPLNVVNQSMGSVQQVVSMAQQGQTGQGQPTHAPADERPEPDEVEPAEAEHGFATADGSTGERAPVDGAEPLAGHIGERAPVDGVGADGYSAEPDWLSRPR